VKYDPDAPLHDRYTQDKDFVTDDEAILRDTTLTINAFFGWDFNSCESLRKDGTWYPIDFANPCPDSQVTSLHRHFPWLVKANMRWSIFCAVTKRKMRRTSTGSRSTPSPRADRPYREKLAQAYAAIAERALRDRRGSRSSARSTWATSTRWRGSSSARRPPRTRSAQGRGAVPGTRSSRSPSCSGAASRPGARSSRGCALRRPNAPGDKLIGRWQRLEREVTLVRWGTIGQPVLLFPTAGGDAEEVERWQMIDVLAPLLDAGTIKVYSCDSLAGKALIERARARRATGCGCRTSSTSTVRHEVVPAIRADCKDRPARDLGRRRVVRRVPRHRGAVPVARRVQQDPRDVGHLRPEAVLFDATTSPMTIWCHRRCTSCRSAGRPPPRCAADPLRPPPRGRARPRPCGSRSGWGTPSARPASRTASTRGALSTRTTG
jgi:hypothetical protein